MASGSGASIPTNGEFRKFDDTMKPRLAIVVQNVEKLQELVLTSVQQNKALAYKDINDIINTIAGIQYMLQIMIRQHAF